MNKNEDIRCFCACCKEYVLRTNDKFVMGGPYKRAMFKPSTNLRVFAHPDCYRAWLMGPAFVTCPRCDQILTRPDGGLLTEHGIIARAQKTVDRSLSIMHQEGPHKHQLMRADVWSKEVDEGPNLAQGEEWGAVLGGGAGWDGQDMADPKPETPVKKTKGRRKSAKADKAGTERPKRGRKRKAAAEKD